MSVDAPRRAKHDTHTHTHTNTHLDSLVRCVSRLISHSAKNL